MFCMQNRFYCRVCNKSLIPDSPSNHLKSQGHVITVLKNQCTNSLTKKHTIRKDK